jgi:hypothetical protein
LREKYNLLIVVAFDLDNNTTRTTVTTIAKEEQQQLM